MEEEEEEDVGEGGGGGKLKKPYDGSSPLPAAVSAAVDANRVTWATWAVLAAAAIAEEEGADAWAIALSTPPIPPACKV